MRDVHALGTIGGFLWIGCGFRVDRCVESLWIHCGHNVERKSLSLMGDSPDCGATAHTVGMLLFVPQRLWGAHRVVSAPQVAVSQIYKEERATGGRAA